MNFNLNVVSIRRFKERSRVLTPAPQFVAIDSELQTFFHQWTKSAVTQEVTEQ